MDNYIHTCTIMYRCLLPFHNVPPTTGAALAVAIALHNIPEGICVSMPIYYATGSKLKAFFWAFLSGLSEPIGWFQTRGTFK